MVLPPDLNQQVLEQLSIDTRQTLEQILSPSLAAAKTTETADKPISIAKLAETWSALWDQNGLNHAVAPLIARLSIAEA